MSIVERSEIPGFAVRDSPNRSGSAVRFCYRRPGDAQVYAPFCHAAYHFV